MLVSLQALWQHKQAVWKEVKQVVKAVLVRVVSQK